MAQHWQLRWSQMCLVRNSIFFSACALGPRRADRLTDWPRYDLSTAAALRACKPGECWRGERSFFSNFRRHFSVTFFLQTPSFCWRKEKKNTSRNKSRYCIKKTKKKHLFNMFRFSAVAAGGVGAFHTVCPWFKRRWGDPAEAQHALSSWK